MKVKFHLKVSLQERRKDTVYQLILSQGVSPLCPFCPKFPLLCYKFWILMVRWKNHIWQLEFWELWSHMCFMSSFISLEFLGVWNLIWKWSLMRVLVTFCQNWYLTQEVEWTLWSSSTCWGGNKSYLTFTRETLCTSISPYGTRFARRPVHTVKRLVQMCRCSSVPHIPDILQSSAFAQALAR